MPTKSKSSTITEPVGDLEPGDWIEPDTCGTILREEFLEPLGITAYQLSKAIGVPQPYVSKILHGGGVSAEMGIRLDRYFGMSNGWWSRLQADYDARMARHKLGDRINEIVPLAR